MPLLHNVDANLWIDTDGRSVWAKMIANQFEVEYVVKFFARYFDEASELRERD